MYEDCYPSWVVHARRRGIRELRWAVFGQTCAGRYLLAVVAPYPQRGLWRAVTARDMERRTRRRYLLSSVAQKLTTARRRALREEAQEWDELTDEDLARLFDQGKPVQIRLRRPPPKTLTVALDAQTLNRLRRIARRKQVGPRQLAAIWIAERLGREQATVSRQRRTG